MARFVTRQVRAERRARAEERQAAYAALSPQQRLERLLSRPVRLQGQKEKNRLTKLIEKEQQQSNAQA